LLKKARKEIMPKKGEKVPGRYYQGGGLYDRDCDLIGEWNGWEVYELYDVKSKHPDYFDASFYKVRFVGYRQHKANYWITVRQGKRKLLLEGRDSKLMKTLEPGLWNWFREYVEMWEAIKP
jgi:hypothetical protein